MQPLILHAHSTGPNPYKAALVLEALNLPYEVKLWQFGDNDKNGLKGKSFLSINENGRVPALQDPNNGVVSWESLAVVNYLVRNYGKDGKLGPGQGWKEQEVVDYEKWIGLLVSTLGPFMGQVNWFKHYHHQKNEDAQKRYEEQSYRCFDLVEAQLQKAGSGFILARGFTAVDAHFYPWIHQYGYAGLSLDKYPNIKKWHGMVGGMKETKAAYEEVANGKEM